jgi:hypothetical protein
MQHSNNEEFLIEQEVIKDTIQENPPGLRYTFLDKKGPLETDIVPHKYEIMKF